MAPGLRLPLKPEAYDLRYQHRDGLPQHGRLGLDAAHAPAQHPQAVDHRGVRIGADDRVRIGLALRRGFVVEDHAAEELEVHLVHDAGVWRHDLEIAERALAPAQEGVAFAVALELDAVVVGQRLRGAVFIHLHGMVDDQLGRRQRVDLVGVAAEAGDRFAHRGQVDHAGHTGEVLHDHARGREGNFMRRLRLRIPVDDRLNIGARDVDAVLKAQQVLEQDLQRIGESRHACGAQRRQVVDLVVQSRDCESRARLETVGHIASIREPCIAIGRSRINIIETLRSRRPPGSARRDKSRQSGPGSPPTVEGRNRSGQCRPSAG